MHKYFYFLLVNIDKKKKSNFVNMYRKYNFQPENICLAVDIYVQFVLLYRHLIKRPRRRKKT